jgi:putative transposase
VWQEGYAAFTVSQSNIDAVRSYIRRQGEHHRKRTFREELAELFEKHAIRPDPRFWIR